MSDLDAALEAAVTELSGSNVEQPAEPVEAPEAVTTNEAPEAPPAEAPSKKYLSLEDLDHDAYIKVGDDIEIPVKDLSNSVLMHKDYTQKTQKLAEERQITEWAKALQESLAIDMDGTFDLLRAAWQQEGNPAAPPAQPESIASDDPLAREVAELKAQFRAQSAATEQARVRSQIAAEVETLQTQYGESFDFNEAAALAAEMHVNLTTAQKLIQADKILTENKRQEGLAKKVEAKRADSVVQAGAGRQSVSPAPTKFTTVDDAFDAAMLSLAN